MQRSVRVHSVPGFVLVAGGLRLLKSTAQPSKSCLRREAFLLGAAYSVGPGQVEAHGKQVRTEGYCGAGKGCASQAQVCQVLKAW